MNVRITTRRARACGGDKLRYAGDIEIANFTQPPRLTSKDIAPGDRVKLVCTLVDVGDPKFRLWLTGQLAPLCGDTIKIELIVRPADVEEPTE